MLTNAFKQGDKVTIATGDRQWMDRDQPVIGTVEHIEYLGGAEAHKLACAWKDASIVQGMPVYHVGHQGQTYQLIDRHLKLAA